MSPQYGELGPLAAEIGLPVWGTPANFNGFRDLAALLHGSNNNNNNTKIYNAHIYSQALSMNRRRGQSLGGLTVCINC